MTARAANALEDSLPIARAVIDGAARHWREKAHEALEVIDAAAVREWVAHVLGIRPRVAEAHLLRADPKSELTRKQIVGDAHLVPVRVGAEGKQRGVLCLPSEAADATVAGRYVGDDRRPAADPVAVAIERIFERQERLVGDGFDEARAKKRDRRAMRHDCDIGGHDRLTAVRRHREQVHQTIARSVQAAEFSIFILIGGAHLDDDTASADRWNAVTDGAAGAVESRAETIFGGLDFGEIVESQTELGKFDGRDPRHGIAWKDLPYLSGADGHQQKTDCPCDDSRAESVHRFHRVAG